jgi:hypothetical protein
MALTHAWQRDPSLESAELSPQRGQETRADLLVALRAEDLREVASDEVFGAPAEPLRVRSVHEHVALLRVHVNHRRRQCVSEPSQSSGLV